jgi:branched-chain amino acid transport system ATP-binding protein
MTALLSLSSVGSGYGRIQVLHDVSLSVDPGKIVSLIGANGAGKTTLMMTIAGMPRLSSGRILFQGEDISRMKTESLIRLGLAYVPEGRRIFPQMTVLENLQMGAYFSAPAAYRQDLDQMLTLFPRLKDRIRQRAGTMSGGEQQMLAIARALMSRPKLLLLDEPSLGLAPLIVRQIFDTLVQLRQTLGLTLLVVEQNARLALSVSDHGYVLRNGRVTLSGTGPELLASHEVQAEYLGGVR